MGDDSSKPLDLLAYGCVPPEPPRVQVEGVPLRLLGSIWFDGAGNVANVPDSATATPARVLRSVRVGGEATVRIMDPSPPLSVAVQRFDAIDERSHPGGDPAVLTVTGRRAEAFAELPGDGSRRMTVDVGGARAVTITLRYPPLTMDQEPEDFPELPEHTATWGFVTG